MDLLNKRHFESISGPKKRKKSLLFLWLEKLRTVLLAVSMGQAASEHQQLASAEDNHQHTEGLAVGPGKGKSLNDDD